MKHTLLITTALITTALMLIVGCSSDPIDVDKLVERGGLLYEVNSDKPYSGPAFSLYENGQKEEEGTLKDGKLDEKWTKWYMNGQKEEEGTYKDGKPDGKWIRWYENGQKIREGTYKNGEPDGLTTTWYENGQKWLEGTYKNGVLITAECWDEDGNEKDCPEE